MIEKDETTNRLDMNIGARITDKQRYQKGVSNPASGDKVTTERIDDSGESNVGKIAHYLQFRSVTTPANPITNNLRVYHKSTGSDSGLFTLNPSGTEVELISSATLTLDLDDAYDNGSTINGDSSDIDLRMTGGIDFKITNNAGANATLTMNTASTTFATVDVDIEQDLNLTGDANVTGDTNITGFLNLQKGAKTIASGAITADASFIALTGQGAAADDLDTINGGSEGDILVLESVSSSVIITIKDATGNIRLSGSDFDLDVVNDKITLIKGKGNEWHEISRSSNTN